VLPGAGGAADVLYSKEHLLFDKTPISGEGFGHGSPSTKGGQSRDHSGMTLLQAEPDVRIAGRFYKRLERRGFCGSLMVPTSKVNV
jgi:hypothetical protein